MFSTLSDEYAFEFPHIEALRFLLETRDYKIDQALSEINGLSSQQAYGITYGLMRNQVIHLTHWVHIDALAKLAPYGLTPAFLLDTKSPITSAYHTEVLVDLIEKHEHTLEEALSIGCSTSVKPR